jgi:hypothetical protein
VETNAACDPAVERRLAEDRVGDTAVDPCDVSQWVHASFDLSRYRGSRVEIRFHYFADMAAVEDGALVDNVAIAAIGFKDDFEAPGFQGWKVEGFSLSGGSHDIPVPQFYLLEYRDPYETFDRAYNYDSSLAKPGFMFFESGDAGRMEALDVRYRPGVLVWYYNGEYLWSQNEPAEFGPGNGFLLLVDANPQEYRYPSVPEQYFKNDNGRRYYAFDKGAQSWLREAYLRVMCFERRPAYFPVDLTETDRASCRGTDTPPGERLTFDGRRLLFGYTLVNEVLPGEARESYKSMSTLFDVRVDKEGLSYRLFDRALRNAHSADAPFSLADFPNGLQFWGISDGGEMVPTRGEPFTAVSSFSDDDPSRHLNPYLPFGSANVPSEGLSFQLTDPGDRAPGDAKVKVYFTWER